MCKGRKRVRMMIQRQQAECSPRIIAFPGPGKKGMMMIFHYPYTLLPRMQLQNREFHRVKALLSFKVRKIGSRLIWNRQGEILPNRSEYELRAGQTAGEFFQNAGFLILASAGNKCRTETDIRTGIIPGNTADQFLADQPLAEILAGFEFDSVGGRLGRLYIKIE